MAPQLISKTRTNQPTNPPTTKAPEGMEEGNGREEQGKSKGEHICWEDHFCRIFAGASVQVRKNRLGSGWCKLGLKRRTGPQPHQPLGLKRSGMMGSEKCPPSKRRRAIQERRLKWLQTSAAGRIHVTGRSAQGIPGVVRPFCR